MDHITLCNFVVTLDQKIRSNQDALNYARNTIGANSELQLTLDRMQTDLDREAAKVEELLFIPLYN